MRLEFDLGNSFLKWRLVNPLRVSGGQLLLAELEAWLAEQHQAIDEIWISSVASDSVNHQLANRLALHFGVAPEFARVTKQAAGVVNAYAHPERMGVDRWLVMLAAWEKLQCAFIVVDAGSAINIERVSADGHYLGGTILAGYQMQQRTLLGQTARVRCDLAEGDALQGGVDTASCVASGAELVLRGVAQQLPDLLAKLADVGGRSKLVLTGGDAQHLVKYLPEGLEYQLLPELVMDGLVLAKRENI